MKHSEQMTTSSYFTGKVKQKFEQFFDKKMVERLGKKSGFVQRSPKNITPFAFVAAFIDYCCPGTHSFGTRAADIGATTVKTLRKQALYERMTESTVQLPNNLSPLIYSLGYQF